MKNILFFIIFISSISFSQTIKKEIQRDSQKIKNKEVENFKNLARINLDEVIVIEDSLVSISIESKGNEYIFNPKEYSDFEIDSISQSIRWQKMGLNKYGINTKAFNLIAAIRSRLTGVQIASPSTGIIRLRSSNSINNSKTIPAFVVDDQLFVIPDEIVQDAIQKSIPLWSFYPNIPLDDIVDVEVLRSLAQTNKYGLLGNAGIIKITTKNARKRKNIKSRKIVSNTNSLFFDSPELIAPIFPGCENSKNKKKCFKIELDNFIHSNIRYPSNFNQKTISRVYVRIYIDKYGNISKYKARTTLGQEVFAKEALRVVKTLPKFKPANLYDKNQGVYYSFLTLFKNE